MPPCPAPKVRFLTLAPSVSTRRNSATERFLYPGATWVLSEEVISGEEGSKVQLVAHNTR